LNERKGVARKTNSTKYQKKNTTYTIYEFMKAQSKKEKEAMKKIHYIYMRKTKPKNSINKDIYYSMLQNKLYMILCVLRDFVFFVHKYELEFSTQPPHTT
jgi:hypothetical protein